MTIVTSTFLTFSAIGNREDLTNEIYNISPTETPFQALCGKTKAKATFHEWQRDQLASAAANAQLEGDDISSFTAVTATSRPGNRAQISYKTLIVSGTQDAVDKAGRVKEFTYQIMKRQRELRRDIEFVLTNPSTPTAGSSTSARALRSLPGWYGDLSSPPSTLNVSRGTSGANGTTSASATDGTQRALTEVLLKSALQGVWTNGGTPDVIMTGPFNKTVVSTFNGNNTRTQDTSDKKLIAAIDVYVSDFGTHKVVPNRFSRDRDVHVLDSELWAFATLRPFQTVDLAKTGDATKGMVLAEYTLEARNDSASGIVADVTTS